MQRVTRKGIATEDLRRPKCAIFMFEFTVNQKMQQRVGVPSSLKNKEEDPVYQFHQLSVSP